MSVVISDAMALTESLGKQYLGEQYLWIDALCIINDRENNDINEVECMDVIDNQALLTLAIVSVEHAEQPVLGVLPGSRSPLPRTQL